MINNNGCFWYLIDETKNQDEVEWEIFYHNGSKFEEAFLFNRLNFQTLSNGYAVEINLQLKYDNKKCLNENVIVMR